MQPTAEVYFPLSLYSNMLSVYTCSIMVYFAIFHKCQCPNYQPILLRVLYFHTHKTIIVQSKQLPSNFLSPRVHTLLESTTSLSSIYVFHLVNMDTFCFFVFSEHLWTVFHFAGCEVQGSGIYELFQWVAWLLNFDVSKERTSIFDCEEVLESLKTEDTEYGNCLLIVYYYYY